MEKSFLEFNYEGVTTKTPVYTFTGMLPGSRMIISGGMHGNEVNGIIVCNKLVNLFQEQEIEKTLTGTIIIIPLLNPMGFEQMTRYVPVDNKDLNRCFGFKKMPYKSFSLTYADFLFKTFYKTATHGIDIHDAGGRSALVPHPRIDSCEDMVCMNCCHEMAKWFDSKIVFERNGDPHMLAVHAKKKLGIPVMTLELGGGQLIFPEFHEDTIRGIYNILHGYNYLPGTPKLLQEKQWYLTDRDYSKAREAGCFTPEVKLGTYIQNGERIGTMYYPYSNNKEIITAHETGFIFSLRYGDQIPAGGNLFSLLCDGQCK